jgi:ELWxxDGT repeat protein
MFPAALAVPKLRAEFEKLYRDRKVAEATLIFALERLEAAKADEARDVSTFLVLDPPALPTRKSRPVLPAVVVLFAALGLAGGLGLEWWKSDGRAATMRLAKASRQGAEGSDPRGTSRST